MLMRLEAFTHTCLIAPLLARKMAWSSNLLNKWPRGKKTVKEWRAAETHLLSVSYLAGRFLKTRLDYYFRKVPPNGPRWWKRASNYYLDCRKSCVSWQANAQWLWPKWRKVLIWNFPLKTWPLIFDTMQSVILTLMVSEYRMTDRPVDARELTRARTWVAFI